MPGEQFKFEGVRSDRVLIPGEFLSKKTCRLGTYTKPDGTRCVKHADIAFLNMPQGAFNAERVYGDVTHRAVVEMTAGTPTHMHGAYVRAGAALQHADAEKTRMYDKALRGRQNEKAAILAIEAGGRVHKHFYRLLDTFAMLKADADAGPLDNNTDPAKAKFHKTVSARTKYALMGRIQVARVKCVAERIMLISHAEMTDGPPFPSHSAV